MKIELDEKLLSKASFKMMMIANTAVSESKDNKLTKQQCANILARVLCSKSYSELLSEIKDTDNPEF